MRFSARPTPNRLRAAAVMCVLGMLAACGNGADDSATPAPSSAQESPTPVASTSPSAVELIDVEEAGGEAIEAAPFPDWVLYAFDRVWVAGVGEGIGVFDPMTGDSVGDVTMQEQQCASLDEGFGAVWTATCDPLGVARIDPDTFEETDWLSVDVSSDGESSVGVGEGAVWAVSANNGGSFCVGCRLVAIDPATVGVADTAPIPAGAGAVRAGLGGVWITYPVEGQVIRVDPSTLEIAATIDVGPGPLFLDVGEGGVWVMNQADGSVSHIDPETNGVTTIPVDGGSIQGGDIAVGEGYVWLRGTAELVAQIDPRTDEVVARFGPPLGSGSVDAGGGAVWISAHDVTSVFRLPF